MEAIQGQNCHVIGSRPCLHEVVTPLSWACCFLAYVAIATSDPVMRDQLAYAHLILGKAQAQGGSGWLHYDRAFCQLKVADPTLLCHGTHWSQDCIPSWCFRVPQLSALYVMRVIMMLHFVHWHQFVTSSSFRNPVGHCLALRLSRGPGRAAAGSVRRPESLEFICVSWNCSFPGSCSYCHMCYLSSLAHGQGTVLLPL